VSDAIRIEADGVANLDRTHSWLSKHRGRSIELDRTRRLEFGVPVVGAGAVLIAVTVDSAESATPELGGVVRAIGGSLEGQLVRLVFEGRSPAHLDPEDARSVAADLLGAISRRVDDDLDDEAA
jgi:hypothetical protein